MGLKVVINIVGTYTHTHIHARSHSHSVDYSFSAVNCVALSLNFVDG